MNSFLRNLLELTAGVTLKASPSNAGSTANPDLSPTASDLWVNCQLSDEQETLAELRELNSALWMASAEVVRLEMRTKVLQQHLRDLRHLAE